MTTDHITRYRKKGKMGIKYKLSGFHIIGPLYDDIQSIKGCNYFVRVKYGNKWGVIDCLGKSVLAVNYDDILIFDGETFIVEVDGVLYSIPPEIITPNPPKREPYKSPIWNRFPRKKRR